MISSIIKIAQSFIKIAQSFIKIAVSKGDTSKNHITFPPIAFESSACSEKNCCFHTLQLHENNSFFSFMKFYGAAQKPRRA